MNILHVKVESSQSPERWCVYSHFDKNNKIEPYVIEALKSIRKSGLAIIFVSTNETIFESDLAILKQHTDIISTRSNIGYDFGSYKLGIQYLYNNQIHPKQILITNDSVFGPTFDIEPYINKSKDFDFYGMTDSIDYFYHIQSYFIIYNEKILNSPYFKQFWDSVELIDNKVENFKNKIIQDYEVGGTQFFIKNGFEPGVEFSVSRISTLFWNEFKNKLESARHHFNLKVENLQIASNPSHNYWKILLDMGYPYLKRELLTSNPTNTNISDWPKFLQKISSYNVELIIEALHNFHGNENFIYANQSLEFIIDNMNEHGEIELPINTAFLHLLKNAPKDLTKTFCFDESYYLATSLDVKAAIEKGEATSGLSHFMNHGREEQRRYRLIPILNRK